ncbi:MAG: FKBP-type peptidyl-prolyl cis-trans isomerase [Bacteroidales bacterium]|jgi:FKBP-type peptidyl-prolyl cis-trans isomerase SlyD|nr:FKBP-type peptidyl-prolyl cis-trans isomerase [Bacteroidales bacterium]
MKIGNNTVVSMTYKLTENDEKGTMIQEVKKDKPFVFLYGSGFLLPKFEENIQGLEPGAKYGFALNSDAAYGPLRDDALLELDKKIFEIDGKIDENILFVGNDIPMQNDSGQTLMGKVLEISDDKVKMDFNHPLAGVDLYFKGQIVDVREATPEEIEHGHVHGPEGHDH